MSQWEQKGKKKQTKNQQQQQKTGQGQITGKTYECCSHHPSTDVCGIEKINLVHNFHLTPCLFSDEKLK